MSVICPDELDPHGISNRKPGEKKEAPAEPLKRSIAGCIKALARKPELEVTFASDRPAFMGDKIRLPEPPRRLTTQRRGDPARQCRFHGAAARLSR